MHINRKIYEEIKNTLPRHYSIDIPDNDWELFMEPLALNEQGKVDEIKFLKRQEKSQEIIKKILDIHGKTEIIKNLGYLASLEPRIQEVEPWVRDHVVHAINTFTLGVYILKNVGFPASVSSNSDFTFMWKITGPTHDIGYPIEIAHNIGDHINSSLNTLIEENNSSSPKIASGVFAHNLTRLSRNCSSNRLLQWRLKKWGLDINIHHYYQWLKSRNRTDHGVISALVQLKTIDILYEKGNPLKEKIDKPYNGFNFNQLFFTGDIINACASLFIHNISLEYDGFQNKISFIKSPLAFLLFLCDTFQEWDRFAVNRKIFSGMDFDISCTHNSISLIVPKTPKDELENKISSTLSKRLIGLQVLLNGKTVVSEK